MLLVKFLILGALLTIFVQDMVSRSVHWVLFPVLTFLFITERVLQGQPLFQIWPSIAINIMFLLMQLLIVSAWFSLKKRKWVNITKGLLGWGDVLFLLSAGFYLSVLNFLLFYIASLIIVVIVWLIWQAVAAKKDEHIPLAGLQAFLLAALMVADIWILNIDLITDDRLQQYILQ